MFLPTLLRSGCGWKLEADFNFHSSIIRNVLFPPQEASGEAKHLE